MASHEEQPTYLQLSPDPIRFEPVSRVTNVFFDGTNKEVVSVRGGGTLGVVVQGVCTKETFCMDHRGNITSLKFAPDHSRLAVQRNNNSLELLSFTKGEVGQGVAVECKAKNATLLGFVWVDNDDLLLVTSHGLELYQVSRERVFVRLSRSFTLAGCRWFSWSPECRTLVVGTHRVNAIVASRHFPLHPFQFGPNYSNKMPKCLVDLGCEGTNEAPNLSERDVCVAWVYSPCVLVLRHDTRDTAQLLVHATVKDNAGFKLTHICELGLNGSFAVNVIDSLIIVHHQTSKMSLVFDVALGTEMQQGVCHVYPVTSPAPIRPFCLEEPSVTGGSGSLDAKLSSSKASSGTFAETIRSSSNESNAPSSGSSPAVTKLPCQLYSPTWVVFQPSVIIDARLGCLWTLQLDLPAFASTFVDKGQLVSCLLHRRHAKPLLLQTVRAVAESRSLLTLGPVLDTINAGYRRHLDVQATKAGAVAALATPTSVLLVPSPSGPHNVLSSLPPSAVVESVDLYTNVLAPMMEQAQERTIPTAHNTYSNRGLRSADITQQSGQAQSDSSLDHQSHNKGSSNGPNTSSSQSISDSRSDKAVSSCQSSSDGRIPEDDDTLSYLVSVCLSYLRSLHGAGLPAPAFLHQLVVNALLAAGSFFQLHQLLQYHVLPDSKPLACVLLSRAGVYPACEQLSLDMLARLNTAHDEIIEVLLAHGGVTQALRYARANGLLDTLSCRKFLEAAHQCGSDQVFYSTFTLFARRNARIRGSKPFTEGDHCEVYVRHFNKLFGALPDYTTVVTS